MKLRPAPTLPRSLDIDLARSIRAEQLRLVIGQVVNATTMATLFAMAMAIFLRQFADESLVNLWLALKIAVVVPRIVHARLFLLHGDPHGRRWKIWMRALLMFDGAVWGLAGLWLMPQGNLAASTVVIVSLIGVATMATFTMHADNWATGLYVGPLILPMALNLLMQGDPVGTYGGIGLMVFMAAMLFISQRAHKQIVELLTLRFMTDRMAQQADIHNEAKSRFLATMSHELRTPLHGLLGMTRMARGLSQESSVQEKLDLAVRSGEHLLAIINDILDFSRLEAGKVSIVDEVFDLSALIDEIAAMTAVTAGAKGLRLDVDLQLERPAFVRGDASRIRQVLHNLLGNAVKFTDRGYVRLTVKQVDQPAPTLLIQVRDTGIGIAPADLARVFEPFHQADAVSRRRIPGTGLGLTISRRIAQAMGGDIECLSTVGHGSEFSLHLPYRPARPAVQTAPLLAPLPRLGGTVLLAEDDEVNALVVEASLRRLGLDVVRVVNGGEAVTRGTQSERPDLVLMDCQMPDLDGFEATRQIRDRERLDGLTHLPIVALTAHALAGDSEKCLLAGMDAHLAKPFRDEELAAVLSRFLPAATASASDLSAQADFDGAACTQAVVCLEAGASPAAS